MRSDAYKLRQGLPLRPWRKRGAKAQAIGPSRGGRTTKIHAVTDLLGRLAILRLTAGNVADVTMAGPPMDAAGSGALPDRRQGLRRQRAAQTTANRRCRGRHPGALEPNGVECLQPDPLKGPMAHRGSLLQAEGLPPRRHSLQQARSELPIRRRARNTRRVLGLNESQP